MVHAADRARALRHAPGRRRAAEQLAVELGRPRLDARRGARRVVPPPVRARAARPRLAQPAGARRLRRDPPLLARPRRRRLPHRRRARARQGRDARATSPSRSRTRRFSSDWRTAIDQPEVHDVYRDWRRARRRVRRRPGARRRGRLLRPAPRRAVPAARRAAPRVQLLARLPAVGRRRRSGDRSTTSLAALPIVDVGAREPRRDADRHALRRGARRARPRCSCSRCPARSSSTRGRSSGSRRSTCRTRCARTRSSSACRRRAEGPRRLPRADPVDARRCRRAPWLPQPARGRAIGRGAAGDDGLDALGSTARALALRPSGAFAWRESPPARSSSIATT